MEKSNIQNDHDEMVRKIIEKCIKTGYSDVRANLSEMKKPEMFNNHIPDVTGKISFWVFIFEIETEDTLESIHSEIRWKAFSKYAKDDIQKFFVVVPQGFLKKAESRLEELEIKATIIEIN